MPPFDIYERAFDFACAIVRFYFHLTNHTRTPRPIAEQLLKAGTGIGGNLEEAEGSHSRPDFRAKISNSLKEARETRYWLRLIHACDLAAPKHVEPLLSEADEIRRILTAIRRNSGHRSD